MNRFRLHLVLFLAAGLLVQACSSGATTPKPSNSGRREPTSASSAPEPAAKGGGLPPVPEKQPTAPSRGERRVILFQAKNDLRMVFVNEGHPGLETQKGQLAIALGNPHQPFKVLTEQQLEDLIEAFKTRGFDGAATPFERGDEQYFEPRGPAGERFRGMVYVEDNGRRDKVLGMRPRGQADADGQKNLAVYTDLKALMLVWDQKQSRAELPASGSSGTDLR